MVVDAKAPAVHMLTAFFGLQVVLACGSFAMGLPWLTYQPPYWRTLLHGRHSPHAHERLPNSRGAAMQP